MRESAMLLTSLKESLDDCTDTADVSSEAMSPGYH